MLDPKLFTVEELIDAFVDDSQKFWIQKCEIVPDYMPPFPGKDTRPRCVVRFTFTDDRDGEADDCFLRHSKGPVQRHDWDIYGDDYLNPAIALRALLEAPPPPPVFGRYFCAKFSIQLSPPCDEATGGEGVEQ